MWKSFLMFAIFLWLALVGIAISFQDNISVINQFILAVIIAAALVIALAGMRLLREKNKRRKKKKKDCITISLVLIILSGSTK